jgi:hypothetical protein
MDAEGAIDVRARGRTATKVKGVNRAVYDVTSFRKLFALV